MFRAWDRYAYANNNPVLYNDPTGRCIGPLLFLAPVCVAAVEAARLIMEAMGYAVTAYIVADQMASDPPMINGEETQIGIIIPPGPGALLPALPDTLQMAMDAFGAERTSDKIPESELVNFSRWNASPKEYGEGSTLYRLHSPGRQYGSYWTELEPKSELQWRIDQAVLPRWNTAEEISTLKVPPGNTITGWTGQAAYQSGFYIGGGNQVYLPSVPETWVTTTKFLKSLAE